MIADEDRLCSRLRVFLPNLNKKERNFSLFIIISSKATFLEMNVE